MNRDERLLKRTDRLVSLILFLRGRRKRTVGEMARHFRVSERTIYRDLRSLAEIGVPLSSESNVGYELLKGYSLPPIIFSGRQAAALLMGTEFIKLRSDAAITREANEVAEKIRSVLPESVGRFIDTLNERTALDPYWLHKTPAHEYWASISEAIADRRTVWIEYYVRSRKEITQRQVDPLALVFYTDHWTLIAFDHLRQGIRQFVLEYIQDLQVLTRRFELPGGFELEAYLQARSASPSSMLVRVRFPASIYAAARRSIPARVEHEEVTDDAVIVSFRFENLDYLAQYLLRYGTQITVLTPPALRQYVRSLAMAVAAQHADT